MTAELTQEGQQLTTHDTQRAPAVCWDADDNEYHTLGMIALALMMQQRLRSSVQRWSIPTPLRAVSLSSGNGASKLISMASSFLSIRVVYRRHWLVINIPGSKVNQGEVLTPYMGPSPPAGTGTQLELLKACPLSDMKIAECARPGFHRYVFILFKQNDMLEKERMNKYDTVHSPSPSNS